jgi:hypothetical protein
LGLTEDLKSLTAFKTKIKHFFFLPCPVIKNTMAMVQLHDIKQIFLDITLSQWEGFTVPVQAKTKKL